MSNIAAQQYPLLAGPYRVMLWAMLSRFKTRFVGNLANEIGRLPLRTRLEVIKRVSASLQQFNATFPMITQEYHNKLEDGIRDLRNHRLVNVQGTSAKDLAHCRVRQISAYLQSMTDHWIRLETSTTQMVSDKRDFDAADFVGYRDGVFAAIAEAVWPYYGVIYETGSSAVPQHNFATWVQNSELINEPFLSPIGESSEELRRALLYPAMSPGEAFNGQCDPLLPKLAKLLDGASDAFIDFDEPGKRKLDPVGLVQKLEDEFLDAATLVPIEWGRRHLERKEIGRFVDLYFFNYWIIRCGIRLDAGDRIPAGVLFLGMPSIHALCHLVPPYEPLEDSEVISSEGEIAPSKENTLRERTLLAWKEAGGMAFGRAFRQDTIKLRTKLSADADASVRARQGAAWAHDVKNWTGPIIENLAVVLAELRTTSASNELITATKRAEFNARLLNIVSVGRQYAFQDLANRSGQSSNKSVFLQRFQNINRESVRFYIETAFQTLLALHRGTYLRMFTLEWPSRLEDSVIFEQAEKLLKDKASGEVFSTIIAFLREVVHNIQILKSNKIVGYETINIIFEIHNEKPNIVLRVSQRHIQKDKRETAMPDGLKKANNLYGWEGARLGQIRDAPRLENVSVPVSEAGGRSYNAFEVFYEVIVEFFLRDGELQHVLGKPQAASAVH
jgi:hypothetical protein